MEIRDTLTRPVYDIPGLVKLSTLGRSFLYAEIDAGRLRATKAGRRTVFLADDVAAWLENLRDASADDRK